MSTELITEAAIKENSAELTILGKRLEILRIEKGVSKQNLARYAGTSRQQLWRVMTGKSELTNSLRDRLATALAIEPSTLTSVGTVATQSFTITEGTRVAPPQHAPFSLSDYFTNVELLTTTLRTMPSGDGGRRLKRALLNAVEDLADEAGRALPADYSDIHRRVLSGEL